MARKLQKLLSLVLALSMCMSLLSVTALAEGEDENQSAAPSVATGTADNPTVTGPNVIGANEDGTEQVTTDENGNTKTEKWTETTWEGTTTTPPTETDDGVTPGTTTTVEGKETTKDTTVTDKDGNITSQSGTVEGEETTTKDPSAGDKGESSDVGVTENKNGITVDMTPGGGEATKSDTISRELDPTKFEKWVKDALDGSESSTAASTGKDADGNDTVTGAVTNVTVETNEDGTKTLTRTVTNTDGTKSVEKVTLTYSEDGKRVVGYSKETTTTTVTEATKEPETPDNATVGTGTTDSRTTYSFEIPDVPDDITEEDKLKTDDEGNLNGQAYLTLSDGNTVIGYVKVTYKDGNATYDDPVLGTYYATTTRTETLENGLKKTTTTKTKVTDTTTIKNSVSVTDGEWTVTGEMGAVEEGTDNGKITVTTPKVDENLLQKQNKWDDHLGQLHTFIKRKAPDGTNPIEYVDYGLYSNILLGYWSQEKPGDSVEFGRTEFVHQFKLKDANDNIFYAYCADWTTSAYGNSKYTMENVMDAERYTDIEKEHLQAAAEYGYWGTKNEAGEDETPSQGSLDAVKKLMDDYGLTLKNSTTMASTEIDDGIALAVTQAAIWYYGNLDASLKFGDKGSDGEIVPEEFLKYYYASKEKQTDKDKSMLTPEQQQAAYALYQLLTGQAVGTAPTNALVTKMKEDANSVQLIDKETITGASITVIEKAGTMEIVEEGQRVSKETYKSDLSFTLAIVPSDKNRDVIVSVCQNGEVVDSIRLTKDGDETISEKTSYTVTEKDGKTTYTIKGLTLASGVDINLKLEGTQNLAGGAYLFTSSGDNVSKNNEGDKLGNDSQSFVGLMTENSTRCVNLNVGLKFTVNDPDYAAETESSSTDSTQVEWSASYETYRIPISDGDDDDDETPTPGDKKPTPTPEGEEPTPTPEGEEPTPTPEGSTPTTNIPGGTPTTSIPDGVPATNVPRTGDSSVLWYVLSACSGLGLAGTALLGKKRRDDED